MAAISIDGTPMTALPSDADQINYDNSNSRLSDTQVQDAIDTLANDSSTFVGTTTQWNNLTTAQKKAYKYRLLTDDYTDASIGNLSALHTTDKSSVVGAVNEVKDGLTAQSVTFTPATGVTIDSSVMYRCSNILLGTLWITIPNTLISKSSELGSFDATLVTMFRTIGIATSGTIMGQIGNFRISSSGALSVDNNYALPGEGSYKLDITVPLSS